MNARISEFLTSLPTRHDRDTYRAFINTAMTSGLTPEDALLRAKEARA